MSTLEAKKKRHHRDLPIVTLPIMNNNKQTHNDLHWIECGVFGDFQVNSIKLKLVLEPIRNLRTVQLVAATITQPKHTMEKEIDIDTQNMSATVLVTYHFEDASFDHEFGTREQTEIEFDAFEIRDFELWDSNGENILSNTPTVDQIEIVEMEAVNTGDFTTYNN